MGGDTMMSNQEILSSVLKTAQMGQVGIRSIYPYASGENFRNTLQDQLQEYDRIEDQALQIAAQRGWELRELNPGAKFMAGMMARSHLLRERSDAKIADMMILGNTRGMIKGIHNRHRSRSRDAAVNAISQKLLDSEAENIRQMKTFL